MSNNATCTELTVLDIVPFGHASAHASFYALRLARPHWREWHPGQFIMLRPDSFGLEIPWGRPLGICHMTERHLVCFFQVLGRGTQKMAALRPGDSVRVWGPLGTGFAVEPNVPTLLLAGGMGIVPFVGYVHTHPSPWNLSMLFGHRQHASCYPIDSINERIPVDTLQETQSGDLDNLIFSLGERMRDCAEQKGLVLACGPMPFLRTVYGFAKTFSVRTQLSLENRMACGVGACLGCVTEAANTDQDHKYLRVCTKGPVFWADQITL